MTVLRLLRQRFSYISDPVRDLLLMRRKRNAKLTQTPQAKLNVIEFFTVGNSLNAFLFGTVKSGVAKYRIFTKIPPGVSIWAVFCIRLTTQFLQIYRAYPHQSLYS